MVPVFPVVAFSLLVVVPGAAIRRAWRRRRAAQAVRQPIEIPGVAEPAMPEPPEPELPWPHNLEIGDRVTAGSIATAASIDPVPGWHTGPGGIVVVLAGADQLRTVKTDVRFYFDDAEEKALAEAAAKTGTPVPVFTQDVGLWQFRGLYRFQKPAAKSAKCELVAPEPVVA